MSSNGVPKASSDVLSSDRFRGFTDALVAIIATIMAGPLSHFEKEDLLEVTCGLGCFFDERGAQLVTYSLGFFVVFTIWTVLVRLFGLVERTNDVLLSLTFACLGALCFLPIAFSLMGQYPSERLPVYLTCFFIAVVELTISLTGRYLFRRRQLQADQVNIPGERRILLASTGLGFIICLLSALVNISSPNVAGKLLWLIFLTPYVISVAESHYRKRTLSAAVKHLADGVVPKERLEFFSDGVFSISATLIVLDVAASVVPEKEDVGKRGFATSLTSNWPMILAFLTSFTIIGMFWIVHHSIFHYLKRTTRLINFINMYTLLFISMIPLCTRMLSINHGPSQGEQVSVQFSALVICLIGISQFLLWTVAMCQKETLIKHLVIQHRPTEVALAVKIALLPLLALFAIFFSSLSGYEATFAVFQGLLIATPVLFLVIRRFFSMKRYQVPVNIVPVNILNETTTEHTMLVDSE